MNDFLRDLRYTMRRLMRTPGFTVATVLTLALGIGANTAIFSVVHSVLLKPLPYPEPERLVALWQTAPGVKIDDLNPSLADYVTYREEGRVFTDVAIWNDRTATVTEFTEPERVDGIQATFLLLPMLGIQPVLGRHFTEKDNFTSSADTVMISHAYWQRRFGGSKDVVGKRLMADGAAREIIGVLPAGVWFQDRKMDVVFPVRYNRAEMRLAGYNFRGIGRLKEGMTLEAANADIGRMIPLEWEKFPPPKGMSIKMMGDARLGPNARWLKEDLLGDIGKSLWVVMGTIGMVLLIACANVANLLLVRAEGRGQELAVRAAIGAGRGRIVRELLLESVTLAVFGGMVGLVLAQGVVKLVLYFEPARLPRLEQIAVDGMAVLYTMGIALAAGLTFGAIPAVKQTGLVLAEALRAGGRSASASRERQLTRNVLTVVQVALALVLLVGSGLMVRSFVSLRNVKPGFAVEQVQTLRVSVPRTAAPKDEELVVLHERVVEQVAGMAGVEAVGMMSGLPMTGSASQDPIMARDKVYAADQIPPLRRFITVGPGVFRALGVEMKAGREYTWEDIRQKRQVVVISENFAREYWGTGAAAVGKQIKSNPLDAWSEVIGVVGDVRHDGAGQAAPSCVYWPLRGSLSMALAVRTGRAGTEGLASEIRQAVWGVNGAIPVTEMRTMGDIYERSMSRAAFTLTLLAISGGMALVLAGVGIYAVLSYLVAQRRREIGIRLALGASAGSLKLLFVRHGLLWGGVGAGIGLVAAVALSRAMKALLYEVSPLDPVTYVGVVVMLLGAAGVASYVPARRVTRIDPMESLRAD